MTDVLIVSAAIETVSCRNLVSIFAVKRETQRWAADLVAFARKKCWLTSNRRAGKIGGQARVRIGDATAQIQIGIDPKIRSEIKASDAGRTDIDDE